MENNCASDLLEQPGLVWDSPEISWVKKELAEGEQIPRHAHPGCRIFLTVVRGDVKVTLGDGTVHRLTPGQCLTFRDTTIEAKACAPSAFFVTLLPDR